MQSRLVTTLVVSALCWASAAFAVAQLPDQALNNPQKDRPYVSVDSFGQAYEAARQRRATPAPPPASAVASGADGERKPTGLLGRWGNGIKEALSQKLEGLGQRVDDAIAGAAKPDPRPVADPFPFTDNDASAAIEMVPRRASIVTITGSDGHTFNIVAATTPGAIGFAAAMATPVPKEEGQFVGASNAPTNVVTQGSPARSVGQGENQADRMVKVYRCDAKGKCEYVMERAGGPESN